MNKIHTLLILAIFGVTLGSCEGGGGGSSSSPTTPTTSFTISGTVPGTIIEAYGDNGSYYKTSSDNNSSGMHPFSLSLKAGINYTLFMTVNENTSESIATPIYFSDNAGTPTSIFTANADTKINLNHLTIDTQRSSAIDDNDKDGILDDGKYYLVNVPNDTVRLSLIAGTYTWDIDGDGKHNYYDDNYTRGSKLNDRDDDGITNAIDINPDNDESHSNEYANSIYDRNRDGYYDYDSDRDGYLDDDYDHDNDGDYDYDDDHWYGDSQYGEVEGVITQKSNNLITVQAYEIEYFSLPSNIVVVNTTNAFFRGVSFDTLTIGQRIEVEGRYNVVTNQLDAHSIERED